MSIFRREHDTPSEPALPAKPSPASVRPTSRNKTKTKASESESTHIAAGSRVVGQISGSADLEIHGVVEGEIKLESRVVVGSEGRVEGKILARSVVVGGRVVGNVKGVERIEVLALGSIEGDILSPRVVIAEGAFFKGRVEMTDKVSAPAEQEAAKPEPAAVAAVADQGAGQDRKPGQGSETAREAREDSSPKTEKPAQGGAHEGRRPEGNQGSSRRHDRGRRSHRG